MPGDAPSTHRYFKTRASLRAWFEKHHASKSEMGRAFYRVGSGRPSVTYHEALDEALCFGWIDGIRRTVDGESYTNRFTPRKAGSNWSLVNIRRVEQLKELRLMRPAGLAAFEKHDRAKAEAQSAQLADPIFDAALLRRFKANKAAWSFFQSQPTSYRKLATWFVMSAKRPETRERRLDALIADSDAGRRLAAITSPSRKK